MVIKITPKQSKRINALIKKLCCNYVDSSCLLLYDGGTLACSTSAGTKSTAAISKTQSFRQTGSCLPKSCSQAIKRDAKSASHSSYQGKKPALLPELCRRPKAEESRRAPAQETGSAVSSRFQGAALTRDTVLRR